MHEILLTTGLFVALVTMACSQRLVCYYDRKAATRAYIGKFTPADIDPSLCTHIIFSYVEIDDNNNNKNKLIPADPADIPLYNELKNLKTGNPNLKTLLAVGDPAANDDQTFSVMVASPSTRRNFIDSAISVLQQYSFDGLNLDWRYPDGSANRQKFTSLCQELRTAFDSLSLLLTASVSATQTSGYDVSLIAPTLDFINVLTFNFHSSTETVTAHHSPLGPLSSPLTTEFAMNMWKTQGGAALPANKLNMGIAAFGVAFRLADANINGVGAATSTAPPEDGCFTAEPGFWSHYETCLYRQGGTDHWISSQNVPYTVTEDHWVGYDNNQSVNAKVALIQAQGYGGACVWALDLDDYTGRICNSGFNPFITYLKSIL